MSLLLLFRPQAVAAPAAETPRRVGGYAPTKAEWDRYMRHWHELRRQREAERAARKGLRPLLRELMFPDPPTKPVRPEVRKELKRVERIIETRLPQPFVDLEAIEIRKQMAELLRDIRKRAQEIKKKRRRQRDEEALMHLL